MAEDPFAAIAEPAQSQAQSGADPFAAIAQPLDAAGTTPPAKTETPGYFKEIVGGIGRTVSTLAGIPKQLMTPHETFGASREQEVKMGPVGRLLYNIPADLEQSMEASEGARKTAEQHGEGWAGQALAYGENSFLGPIVKKAEEAGPGYAKFTPQTAGAVTEGAGTYAIAPKIAEETLSKVGQLRQQAKAGVQPFVRKFTQVESALKDEVGAAAEKQGVAEAKHAEATDAVKERQGLAKKVDESSLKLRDHIGKVEESVGKEADKKFDAVREKIGNPVVEPAHVVEAVKSAETNILQGIPENIKEFRVIMGHDAIPDNIMDAAEAHGFELGGQEPLTWDKLQSLKSRIDAKLRQSRTSRMNGDVKRALYSVQNSIVDTMGTVAEAAGAGDLWADAKKFYRQYKEDFHEPSGPSGSGSPVAQALDAVDPKNIRQPFIAKNATTGNRGVDILRKYPQHGGTEAAATAEELLGHHDTLRRGPGDKLPPKAPETPVVDARQVARDAIAKRAKNWGSFNARDIGVLSSSFIGGPILWMLGERSLGGALIGAGMYEAGKYGASRVLNSPRIIEWLANTPVEEAAALAKIPGADKVKIVDGLTQIATQTGKPVQLSGPAKQLLGPANVAKIMAAGGAAGATQVKNRKDALDLLSPDGR